MGDAVSLYLQIKIEQKGYSSGPGSRRRIGPDAGSDTMVQTTKTSKYQMLHIVLVNIKIQVSLMLIIIHEISWYYNLVVVGSIARNN